jgi:hypothetical protein
LIGIPVVVALSAFADGFGVKQLTAFGLYVVKNTGLLPLVFVAISMPHLILIAGIAYFVSGMKSS